MVNVGHGTSVNTLLVAGYIRADLLTAKKIDFAEYLSLATVA